MPHTHQASFRIALLSGFFRSLFDLAGLAVLLPVIQIVLSPQSINENKLLHTLYQYGAYQSAHHFAFHLMLYALLFFVIKTIATYFIARYQSKVAYSVSESIALYRFSSYLNMPYSFYLQNNSGVLMRNFLIIPFEFGQRIIIPFIQLVNEVLVLILIIIAIVLYQPLMILAIAGIMSPVIYLYQTRLKQYLKDISVRKDISGKMLFKHSSQSMNLYREIILHQKAEFFENKFKQGTKELAQLNVRMTTLNEFSPKLTELIAVAGIALVFIISVLLNNSNEELVQFLVLFALAISRLLPASNRIILQSSTIRANEYVFDYLKELMPIIHEKKNNTERSSNAIKLNKDICIRNISYTHEGQQDVLFQNLNLTIQKGETIGLIGPSGSGKTTLLNIILRLLTEQEGGIYIDEQKLTNENKSQWYAMLGFVPQNINIIDGTFIDNIAFGIDREFVDFEKVKRVAQQSMLSELIESQANTYETHIGEGGLKISGGQRQRIGIARALYRDAQVLLFDEATSALDSETETLITESLRELSHQNLTIIVVAHRLDTLKYCDVIYKLDKGSLSQGTSYTELLNKAI